MLRCTRLFKQSWTQKQSALFLATTGKTGFIPANFLDDSTFNYALLHDSFSAVDYSEQPCTAALFLTSNLRFLPLHAYSNGAVMGSLDVRLSVCPSVTLVIPDHIRRARWNFITRLISPMSSLAASKISAI